MLGEVDQIYRYNTTTDSWATLPGASPVVFDPVLETPDPPLQSITTDGGKLYATAGGYSFYSYTLSTGMWGALPRLPAEPLSQPISLVY